MKMRWAVCVVLLAALAVPVFGHRLDEYLQASMISLEKDRVQILMRLIPGVAVSSSVLAEIDSNGDGLISESERRAYAERVLGDLSLSVDGQRLQPRLVSVDSPTIEQIKEGLGEIHIEIEANLPRAKGSNRRLVFENHHESRMAAYLVNCLVPQDRDIRVVAQDRNENQSLYRLDYVQAASTALPPSSEGWGDVHSLQQTTGVSLSYWVHGLASMFRLGMRHIAEGTDHLLFLLTLLLPAPLLAAGSRWAGFGGVRYSVLHILKIVTAFTLGHSVTLALAGLGLVTVPSRPIEVLIAVSILISAAHALRPIFPGREAGLAAFFGLIHGLAFAATLGQLGLGRWERVASILGFNLGIESMQLIVVGVIMPSLVLLSRTRAYSVLRIGGALFAGMASVGWIAERLLQVPNSVDAVVDSVAHHAVWIAAVLFLISFACWSLRNVLDNRPRAVERLS